MNAPLADRPAEQVSASVGKAERIGRFRLVKRMPSPGSRDVFLAMDLKGQQVVLEVLGAPQRNQGLFDPTLADEAATYAGLSHPNLVKVVDLFSADGRFVIAIEYIDGTTLDVLRSTFAGLPAEQTDAFWMYVLSCVFDGLAAAHEATAGGKPSPVLHRNITPANVQVAWDGSVKLGNFNVANVATVLRDSNPAFTWSSFGYLAPEQVRLAKAGPASDVYSAMLVLWELLAGRKAIEGGKLSDEKMLELMASPKLAPLDVVRPSLDARVLEAVRVGLEAHPAKRKIDAARARDVLRSAIDVEATRRRFEDAVTRARSSLDAPTLAPPPSDEKLPVPAARHLAAPPLPKVIVAASESNVPAAHAAPPPVPRPPPPASKAAPPPPPQPPSRTADAPAPLPATPPAPPVAEPPPAPVAAAPLAPPPMATAPSTAALPPPTPMAMALGAEPELELETVRPPPAPPPTTHAEPEADTEMAFDASPGQARRKRAARIAVVASLGLVACILVAAGVARLAGHHESTAMAAQQPSQIATATAAAVRAPTPTPTPTPTSTSTSTPTATATAMPAAVADTGEIELPPSSSGHRVYVDGHVVGEGPKPVRVHCGPHAVRIGSAGHAQHVDVPCGASIAVER